MLLLRSFQILGPLECSVMWTPFFSPISSPQDLFTLSTCQERGTWEFRAVRPLAGQPSVSWGRMGPVNAGGGEPLTSAVASLLLAPWAKAALCSAWTRPAIEAGQRTPWKSKGWRETKIRHFTESEPCARSPRRAPACLRLNERFALGCASEPGFSQSQGESQPCSLLGLWLTK